MCLSNTVPPTICLPRKKVQVRKECNSNHKKANQFINTLVCDCSSCASQLPRRVTYIHKQSTFQYMLINKPLTLIMSSLVNFDKEGSKFEKKNVCVCVWRGGGEECAMTPKLYAKLFFFLNIFFLIFNIFIFNIFDYFLIFFFFV